jgi:hypothetical protein
MSTQYDTDPLLIPRLLRAYAEGAELAEIIEEAYVAGVKRSVERIRELASMVPKRSRPKIAEQVEQCEDTESPDAIA